MMHFTTMRYVVQKQQAAPSFNDDSLKWLEDLIRKAAPLRSPR